MKYLTERPDLPEQLLIETVAQPNGVIVIVKNHTGRRLYGAWLNPRKDENDTRPMLFPVIYDQRAQQFLDICNRIEPTKG